MTKACPISTTPPSSTKTTAYLPLLLAILPVLWLLGCRDQEGGGDLTQYPKGKAKTTVRYAKAFDLQYFKDFTLLSIYSSAQVPRDTLRFVLVSKSVDLGSISLPKAYPIIRTPIERLALTATTQVGLCVALDARSTIAGIAGARFVYDSLVNQAIKKGEITDLGSDVTLDQEAFMTLNPEVVMLSTMGDFQFGKYAAMEAMGIVLLPNVEWLDQHPLGRAEWVKVLAALTEREPMANQFFEQIAQRYEAVRKKASAVRQKPVVLSGSPYKGEWHVPGSNSFKGQLLRDAGATWPWQGDSSAVSLPISFEVVYQQGLQADFWIEPGNARSITDIVSMDERYADFKSVREGSVFNATKRKSADGLGSDLWESGVARPDRILADMAKIFHPELLPADTLFYFERLESP